LLGLQGKRGGGPKVVGLQAQCETRTDFVVQTAASDARSAGSAVREG
jgi:hypothetical protein